MQPKELHTERLQLRMYTPEVANHVFTSMTDAEIMAFLGLDSSETLQKEKDKFSRGLTTYNRTFLNFHIIEKETGTIIGGCGFHTWSPDHMRAEIGYALYHDNHKQKGFMKEALLPILHYGFEEMKLHRVEALIGPENIASQKLLMSFNFVEEGVLREHYVVDGIPQDSIAYSLLKPEFKH